MMRQTSASPTVISGIADGISIVRVSTCPTQNDRLAGTSMPAQ